MVGRFSLGGNSPDPPPPYKDPAGPLYITETTTQVLTTTTQTTHFFSLPLWKKRPSAPLPVSSASSSGSLGNSRDRLRVEKDLPPTPSNEEDLPLPSTSSRKSLSASQSSAALLAHASLGIGLPHAMRNPSASSSTSDVNTIAFVTNSDPPVRRTKSSQKLRATSAYDPPGSIQVSFSEGGKRRSRGISLGTTAAFLTLADPDPKGKGKETAPPMPKTSLVRRASFWSRKKAEQPEPITPRDDIPLPTLPSVLPMTPFTMDDFHASSPSSHSQHARRLSRSHSARDGGITNSALSPSDTTRPRRASKRPATADSSARSPSFPDSPPPLPPPPVPRSTLPVSESDAPSRRPRAQTNPPLLYRLSMNLFSSSSASSSNQSSTMIHESPRNSPTRSASNSPRTSLNKTPVVIPKPEVDHESPELYLRRLLLAVSKAEVAGILASSADPFHIRALRAYISDFDFVDDPLDVALRKLLMHVGLPRETQQIDRVMEAFAGRYLECNPNLFVSDDHPYILAFSLIMLHTDAFNKSNKRKMTKADYIKNTRLPGVPPEVLDCFYDNIVVTPFIFIEDPLDVNGQRGLVDSGPTRSLSLGNPLSASGSGSGTTLLGKAPKVDPYYLIANNLLGPLRVDVDAYVPRENPYSFQGTAGSWDEQDLRLAFANANVIEVGSPATSIRVTTLLSLGPGGVGGALPQAPLPMGLPESPPVSPREASTLRVTKVGILNRKDDVLEGGKKSSNRKWKPWSVILTGSQLLLFRDPAWAAGLVSQAHSPDAQDAIAIVDRSYTKHDNAFRFVMQDGRQFLLQSSDEQELNEWVSRINYASTFKTAGIRMRPLGMSGKDVQLTGVAAATSHLHDLQTASRGRKWDNDAPRELMGMLSAESESPVKRPPPNRRVTMLSFKGEMDLDIPTAPEIDGADQFKATFDQVKAALAAGEWGTIEPETPVVDEFPMPGTPSSSSHFGLPSRSHIIQSKVRDLDGRISAAQSQLDSDLRFVRNIGTLTPFQRATRERLHVAVQAIAKRITQVRIEMTKLLCHRHVLWNDSQAESRDWSEANRVALQAATETLQIRGPRMTVSDLGGSSAEQDTQRSPGNKRSSSSHRPDSTCDSFHSALEFSEDTISSDFLSASIRVDTSSSPSSSTSTQSLPIPDSSPSLNPGSSSSTSHERFFTALENPEPAEEWDQTRCAQRVSLVRVPSDIRLSTTRFTTPRSLKLENINT
ncbi:hypothetical protein FB45DRAFT_916156 [Roridomyces roridus]|uniref:SEC7 domain-containing protein n=1 Tax=Roridomyces roridus TaxID=1738132 RepID=A0AAD7FLD5_9AGAR|nr:hypothetical protein FB45DRAFT_916156 [Roridomyces roridus]